MIPPRINESRCESQAGATLIEVLIAAVVLTLALAAAMPIFMSAPRYSSYSDARQLCQNLVKNKLDDLKGGKIRSETLLGTYFQSFLKYSDFMYTRSATGVIGNFDYLKFLYNRDYTTGICNGESSAVLFAGAKPVLGLRACAAPAVGGALELMGTDAAPPVCNDTIDTNAVNAIPGFKLYVKIELSTPWGYPQTGYNWTMPGQSVADTSVTVNSRKYATNCPDEQAFVSSTSACLTPENCAVHSDFSGHLDSIRLTVTGVMDIGGASIPLTELGTVPDTDIERLSCQASSVVYPNRSSVARFMVNREGQIRWAEQGRDDPAPNPKRQPFQGISQKGIISISVHPRNFGIWVLKEGGYLTRYGNCGSVPIDCDPVGLNDDTVLDNGVMAPGFGIMSYRVDTSIRSITADYANYILYGVSRNGENVYEIKNPGGTPIMTTTVAACANPHSTCVATLNQIAPTDSLGVPVTDLTWYTGTFPSRMNGFFLSPDARNGYTWDLTTDRETIVGVDSYYSSTIYSTNYKNVYTPVMSIPFSALSFSP